MPEMPEVQTVVNGLNNLIRNLSIEKVSVIWPDYITGISHSQLGEKLVGQRVLSIGRRGKYILFELEKNYLILHLRMTGRVVNMTPKEETAKHTHFEIFFQGGIRLGFNDVRKFGRLEFVQLGDIDCRVEKMNLGPEPLGNGFNATAFFPVIRKSSRAVKTLLLDQRIVAGLGNIYVCEVLFRSGVHPSRSGMSLTMNEVEKIVSNTKEILEFAISKGGSSIRDYVNVDGETGNMQNHFQVYGFHGKPCVACGEEIKREKHAGRSSFFCPRCQK